MTNTSYKSLLITILTPSMVGLIADSLLPGWLTLGIMTTSWLIAGVTLSFL